MKRKDIILSSSFILFYLFLITFVLAYKITIPFGLSNYLITSFSQIFDKEPIIDHYITTGGDLGKVFELNHAEVKVIGYKKINHYRDFLNVGSTYDLYAFKIEIKNLDQVSTFNSSNIFTYELFDQNNEEATLELFSKIIFDDHLDYDIPPNSTYIGEIAYRVYSNDNPKVLKIFSMNQEIAINITN